MLIVYVYFLIEHVDYAGGLCTALIPEGKQEAYVTINIINDMEEEPDEKFKVVITPTGLPKGITAKEGADHAEITIINDDCKYLMQLDNCTCTFYCYECVIKYNHYVNYKCMHNIYVTVINRHVY